VATNSDPLNINARLYKQLGKLLDDMEAADRDERMTMPQRIQALIAVGRIQVLFNTIRKGSIDDGSAGSAVRKYAQAFSGAHATRRRAASARPVVVDDGGDDDGDGDDAA
jgi:hypothetical protein